MNDGGVGRVVALVLCIGAGLVLLTVAVGGRLALGPDALVHAAYVYEVHDGLVPPPNPVHLGAPAHTAWLWSLLVAGVAAVTRTAPIVAGPIANGGAMIGLLGALWAATGFYTRRTGPRAAFTLAPILLADPALPVRTAWDALHGLPIDDPTPAGLVGAFAMLDGFAIGAALYGAAVLVLLRHRWNTRARVVAGLLLGILAGELWPPAVAAIGWAAIGTLGAIAGEHADRKPVRWDSLLREMGPALALLAGGLVVVPYLTSAGLLDAPVPPLLTRLVAGIGPGLAALVAGGVGAWRYAKLTRATRQLVAMTLATWLGAVLVPLPVQGPYREPMLAAIPASLLLLALLDEMLPGWRVTTGSGAKIRQRLVVVGLLSTGIVAFVTPTSYALASWGDDERYAAHGMDVDLVASGGASERANRQLALAWIRDHTPESAIVLEEPPPVALLEVPVVARRRTVVAQPSAWSDDLGDHDVLVDRAHEVIASLRDCSVSTADLAQLFAVPERWPRSLYAIVQGGRRDCASLPPGVQDVYDNADYVVYVIQVPLR